MMRVSFLMLILAMATPVLADDSQNLVLSQLQSPSPALAKCQAAGENARQNPNPCQSGDYGCAMRIQQEANEASDVCKKAVEELMPTPLPVQTNLIQ